MSASSRDTAIVGIGQTEFSKHSGRSELQLAAEAVAAAVADAGLTPADIDGAVTFAMDVNDELSVIRCAGIPELRFTAVPAVAVGVRARRCSSRRPWWHRVPRTWWAESPRGSTRSDRGVASVSPSPRTTGVRVSHPPAGTGTSPSGSTRRPRCIRSGTSATCTPTTSPTSTSACTPSSPGSTCRPTPPRSITSNP